MVDVLAFIVEIYIYIVGPLFQERMRKKGKIRRRNSSRKQQPFVFRKACGIVYNRYHMPTSNAEELGLFLKCTVIGRGVFGPCACTVKSGNITICPAMNINFWFFGRSFSIADVYDNTTTWQRK